MRAAIPTDLLWRLMNATPEQYAAVERALGGAGEGSWELEDRTKDAEGRCAGEGCVGDGRAEFADATEGTEGRNADTSGEDRGSATGNRPTVSEDVARSAFALLQKLELDAPLKSPSALTVFRLYCVDGHSADRVARKCRCGKATVIRRLRFIEERTGVKADQFRAMSGHLQQVDDDLNASGARDIYRKGLANENEPGKWDE